MTRTKAAASLHTTSSAAVVAIILIAIHYLSRIYCWLYFDYGNVNNSNNNFVNWFYIELKNIFVD